MFQKLRKKWGIQSNWDIFAILLTFSLAGMSIVFIRRPLFITLGITNDTPFIIKFITWIITVFPTYQISLLLFGTLLGQFQFFWAKEKQIGKFFLQLFLRNK